MISFLINSKNHWRIFFCVLGNMFIGLGVAFTKIASFGNDSFNGMNMAVSALLGINFVVYTWIFNLASFTFEFFFGKKYIFVGTFLNWFLVSFFVDLFLKPMYLLFPVTPPLLSRIILLLVGLLICCFGLALYQNSNLGISPYDVLPIIFCDRFPKVPYAVARLTLDVSACVVMWLCGGLLGVGTLVNSFLTGPLVFFYTKIFKKLHIMQYAPTVAQK